MKKSAVPAPVANLESIYEQIWDTFGARMLIKISKPKDIIERKYIIEQVKYMTNLTLTTEKHAIKIAEIVPKSANAKKHP